MINYVYRFKFHRFFPEKPLTEPILTKLHICGTSEGKLLNNNKPRWRFLVLVSIVTADEIIDTICATQEQLIHRIREKTESFYTYISNAFSLGKLIQFDKKIEISSNRSNWQWVSIGSDNGLAPFKHHAIIWTNVKPDIRLWNILNLRGLICCVTPVTTNST